MPTDSSDLSALMNALENLPPLCKRVFILVRYEGMTIDRAAAELGIPRWLCRRLANRAFGDIQAKLKHLLPVVTPVESREDTFRLRAVARAKRLRLVVNNDKETAGRH